MCGIVGYIGNNTSRVIIDCLHKIEYRGYDSSGIALVNDNDVSVYKAIGKVKDLEKILPKNTSKIGIGHTRWATHGEVNLNNAHPHTSLHKRYSIVHNGIIENYLQIKEKYLTNYSFVSKTDTEVLVDLMEYLSNKMSTLEMLSQLSKYIVGSYALAIIDHKDLEKIYFIKNLTPLIINHGKNEILLSSDLVSLENIDEYYVIKDGEYGYFDQKHLEIYEKKLIPIIPQFKKISPLDNDIYLDGYDDYMEKEIHQEPMILQRIIDKYLSKNGEVIIDSKIIETLSKASKIYLVGCGSSYYASKLGRYYINKYTSIDCEELLSSEVLYNFHSTEDNPVFVFISQSGETLDVINFLKKCQKDRYSCISICNSNHSTIARLCEYNIPLLAGKEISVASTKAFFCQSIILYLISQQLSNKSINIDYLKKLIYDMHHILINKDNLYPLAHEVSSYHDVFILGKNIDYIIALEGALKLKEISYIHAEAFPSGELKHGTLALINSNTLVISLISQNTTSSIMRVNIAETISRGSNNINFVRKRFATEANDYILENDNDDLIIFEELMILQLIAHHVSKIKGNDIDHPRNLAKSVTVE